MRLLISGFLLKGITKEKIIEESERLIAEGGLSDFSLHMLAERLGIKTASLYTHVSGIEEVMTEASVLLSVRPSQPCCPTPIADQIALVIALLLFVPYLKKISQMAA